MESCSHNPGIRPAQDVSSCGPYDGAGIGQQQTVGRVAKELERVWVGDRPSSTSQTLELEAACASKSTAWRTPAIEDTASKSRPMLEVGTVFKPGPAPVPIWCRRTLSSSAGQARTGGRSAVNPRRHSTPAADRCDRAIR